MEATRAAELLRRRGPGRGIPELPEGDEGCGGSRGRRAIDGTGGAVETAGCDVRGHGRSLATSSLPDKESPPPMDACRDGRAAPTLGPGGAPGAMVEAAAADGDPLGGAWRAPPPGGASSRSGVEESRELARGRNFVRHEAAIPEKRKDREGARAGHRVRAGPDPSKFEGNAPLPGRRGQAFADIAVGVGTARRIVGDKALVSAGKRAIPDGSEESRRGDSARVFPDEELEIGSGAVANLEARLGQKGLVGEKGSFLGRGKRDDAASALGGLKAFAEEGRAVALARVGARDPETVDDGVAGRLDGEPGAFRRTVLDEDLVAHVELLEDESLGEAPAEIFLLGLVARAAFGVRDGAANVFPGEVFPVHELDLRLRHRLPSGPTAALRAAPWLRARP